VSLYDRAAVLGRGQLLLDISPPPTWIRVH
jgi:hypothetical protein